MSMEQVIFKSKAHWGVHGKFSRLSQLLPKEPMAVALIAICSRWYFENLEPPIGVFASQMSHLFQKPTLREMKPRKAKR